MTWMVVLGTILPFFLLVSALRHLPATRVAIIAMLEPVVATVVAWAWLGESLSAMQLDGRAGRPRRDRARADGACSRPGSGEARRSIGPNGSPAPAITPNDRGEPERVERLRHELDAAEAERERAVAQLRAAREEARSESTASAHRRESSSTHSEPVEAGQHHVEDDRVDGDRPSELDAAQPVAGLEHLDPLRLEVDAAEEADRRLVVDHEHGRRVGRCCH